MSALSKEQLIRKANEYLNTQEFKVKQQQTGYEANFKPIKGCDLLLPVNSVAMAVLQGFINYAFSTDQFEELTKNIQLPPEN